MTDARIDAAPTRRRLLAAVGLGLAGLASTAARLPAAVGGAGTAPEGKARLPYSLRHGSLAEWTGAVGQTFAVGGTGIRVKLAAVTPLQASGKRPFRARADAFLAVFETSAGRAIEGDRIHRLTHAVMAPLDVHVGAPVKVGRRLQLLAVFN